MTPEDFSRAFAYAFGDHDSAALTDLIAPAGTVQTLTGLWAEGHDAAKVAFAAEMSGIFSRARLVTGKGSILPISTQHTLLRQRFVVSGALDEKGAEISRFSAMLVALLQADGLNWWAESLTFSILI